MQICHDRLIELSVTGSIWAIESRSLRKLDSKEQPACHFWREGRPCEGSSTGRKIETIQARRDSYHPESGSTKFYVRSNGRSARNLTKQGGLKGGVPLLMKSNRGIEKEDGGNVPGGGGRRTERGAKLRAVDPAIPETNNPISCKFRPRPAVLFFPRK